VVYGVLSYECLFPGKKEKSKNGNTEEHISQNVFPDSETANVDGGQVGLGASGNVTDTLVHIDEESNLQKELPKDVEETCTKEAEEEEVELDNLFFEDSSTWEVVAPEILKQQKIEELSHDGYGHLLGNIDDVWKKVMRSYTIIM
jgi:ATP-dependent RNA helicase DHX29